MKEWRRQALRQIPTLKRFFRRADDPMTLWVDLHMAFCRLHDDMYRLYGSGPRNREAIRQVYAYARWCFFKSGDHNVAEAAAFAFYEHLPLDEAVRRDVLLHLSWPEFEALEGVFRYHLDTDVLYDGFRNEFRQGKAVQSRTAIT